MKKTNRLVTYFPVGKEYCLDAYHEPDHQPEDKYQVTLLVELGTIIYYQTRYSLLKCLTLVQEKK